MVQHLRCRRVKEKDLEFESHMSGFVYKVRVSGQTLIKKEIPGPDTVDEFLYEVNALNSLKFSESVIDFYGVVVDDNDEHVKGLLIEFAGQGALVDMIYDSQERGFELDWPTRQRWARQIVQGLSDVHEAGFVQGDFTLSNIVIDDDDNAKIIDINRRGCPVGWEPPEATPLIDSNQRISMYIGVKSDLYQLGMVLWALATLEDEPEAHRRPLHLDPEIDVPKWYRRMVENCLNPNPRMRVQATALLAMFPEPARDGLDQERPPSISVDDGYSMQRYMVDGYGPSGVPQIRTVTPQNDWGYSGVGYQPSLTSPSISNDGYYYPPRGRSPPSPLPSHRYGVCDSPYIEHNVVWTENTAPSVCDVEPSSQEQDSLKESRSETTRAGLGDCNESLKPTKTSGAGFEMQTRATVTRAKPLAAAHETECISTGETTPVPEDVTETALQERASRPGEGRDLAPSDDLVSAQSPTDLRPSESVHTSSPTTNSIEGAPTRAAEVPRTDDRRETNLQDQGDDADAGSPDSALCAEGSAYRCGKPSASESSPSGHVNYVHTNNRKGNIYKRPTEAGVSHKADGQGTENPLSNSLLRDLTGIGAAYGSPLDDVRQPACSDEDLGLTTTTTTTTTTAAAAAAASQNVTSQA
jgi:serine/threonine protein kinase